MTWIIETIGHWLNKNLMLEEGVITQAFGRSRNPKEGDFTLAAFPVAKALKKNPVEIAGNWAKNLKELPPLVKELKQAGPYLNFKLDGTQVAQGLLKIILENSDSWGTSKKHASEKVFIDFSSPNIAKPFAIHHIRSTLIGAAVANTLETQGYDVERVNHLGDWGTQFGYTMLAWKKYHGKDDLGEHPIKTLVGLYQKISSEAKEAENNGDSSIRDEAAAWFKKLEDGDDEARKLWAWFREVSIQELEKIYKRMGIHFDTFRGEAFYEDQLEATLNKIKDLGLLKESQGAQIVDLGEKMPPILLQKSDGATLYATRDIAALLDRWQRSNYAFNLYVVATQQNLHFKQLFKLFELMNHPSQNKNKHISFGMLRMPDGTLGKTRSGNVIYLDEVLDMAQEKALERMKESESSKISEEIAEQIGLGAVYFNDLKAQRNKDVTFNWDDVLSFEGRTGAYLQYAQARMNRILEKGNWQDGSTFDGSLLTHEREKNLLMTLDQFPQILKEAAEKFEPNHILNYLFELVQVYSNLTQDKKEGVKVLVDETGLRQARLSLVAATRQTLINGLKILCIPCPQRM